MPVAILKSDDPVDLTFVEGTALLDTGATSSGISAKIVAALGLRSYAKKPLRVATEERLVEYFMFRLGFLPQRTDPNSPLPLPYVFADTNGFKIVGSQEFDVILGMDVLKQYDLNLRRSGDWELRYG